MSRTRDFSASFANVAADFETGASETAVSRAEWRELKASHQALQRELKRKEKALAETAALWVLQKSIRRSGRKRTNDGLVGAPTNYFLIDEVHTAGARQARACALLGITLRTLQRWRQLGEIADNGCRGRQLTPANKLNEQKRQAVLAIANSAEFAALAPSQIVPILAERGQYLASESTFYRILRDAKQLKHRQASRAAIDCRKPKALKATAPNQLYSWDITYLPTAVRGCSSIFICLGMFTAVRLSAGRCTNAKAANGRRTLDGISCSGRHHPSAGDFACGQ